MTDIMDEYCKLKRPFKQEDEDGDFIQIELFCQYKKGHNRHGDSKYIEHGEYTTIIHMEWTTTKTEELR